MYNNYITQKLKQLKFSVVTPIQKELFLKFHQPYNLIGISPTGTGKTHAYLLPILSKIDWNKNIIQAIIVIPTNELVFQIFLMLKEFEIRNSQIKIFYGGMDKKKISLFLEKKQPNILITTLDKLYEYSHILKKINICTASFLVLDEADMLFDQKSLNSLDVLLKKWNPKILLFSASITIAMQPFINKYFGKSLFLDVNSQHKLNLKYFILQSPIQKRLNDLKHLLINLNPYLSLIFVSKKQEQTKIYNFLKQYNLKILNFSSDLSVKKRKQYILEIKKMKYQYILTSDLMSRGLDLDVSWVIHYDLPKKNIEFFMHRSGRTGRMNKKGNVVIFYDIEDQNSLQKIKKINNIDFQKIILTKNGFQEKNKKNLSKNNHNQIYKKNKFIENQNKTKDYFAYKDKNKKNIKFKIKNKGKKKRND
ncbi:DEAD/DEAH box helicase [Candidatus Phytoplasma pini]|uniref:Dead/DEAH box helicase n=1 Tax=Candidatus Phytoplasma pini TaxID=267362 RepID=A0A559KK01_9MOLU|nr:DEAD/DEAH box helicase [Candidatus Phytoplasma pini]TVY12456.1 Dead/DEAH box helicase [Candidatus Phytoplasma pini]